MRHQPGAGKETDRENCHGREALDNLANSLKRCPPEPVAGEFFREAKEEASCPTTRQEKGTTPWAAVEDFEVAYLANRCGISKDEAKKLIKKHGNNLATLEKIAESLKR